MGRLLNPSSINAKNQVQLLAGTEAARPKETIHQGLDS
jgi:hypothetical protein